MTMEALANLLESGKGGVWFVPAADARGIPAAAKKAGFACFHIDGKSITRKEQFLNHTATALRFPESFGNNWDALEECLRASHDPNEFLRMIGQSPEDDGTKKPGMGQAPMAGKR